MTSNYREINFFFTNFFLLQTKRLTKVVEILNILNLNPKNRLERSVQFENYYSDSGDEMNRNGFDLIINKEKQEKQTIICSYFLREVLGSV